MSLPDAGTNGTALSGYKSKQICGVGPLPLTSHRDVLWKYLVRVFGTCLTTFDCPPCLRVIYQKWNALGIYPNLPHIMQAELIWAGMCRVLTKILADCPHLAFLILNIFI